MSRPWVDWGRDEPVGGAGPPVVPVLVGAVGIVLGVIAIVMLVLAPVCRADDGAFIAGVRGLGFGRSDNYLIDTAHAVCMRFAMGNSRDQADQSVVRQFGVAPDAAHQFVGLAAANYCPGGGQ